MYPTNFDKNDIRANDVVRFDMTKAGSRYGIVDRVTGPEECFSDHIRVVTFEKPEAPGLYRRSEVERVNRFRVDDGTGLRYFGLNGTEAVLSEVKFEDGTFKFKTTWAAGPRMSFWNDEDALDFLIKDVTEMRTKEVKVAGATADKIIVDERTTSDIYDMAGPLMVGDIVSLDRYRDKFGVVDGILKTRPDWAYRVNVDGHLRLVHRDNLTRLNKVRIDTKSAYTRKTRETGNPVVVGAVLHSPELGIIYDCIWNGQSRKVGQTVLLNRTVAVPKPAPVVHMYIPPKEPEKMTNTTTEAVPQVFAPGAQVKRKDGRLFSDGNMTVTLDRREPMHSYPVWWLKETSTKIEERSLEVVELAPLKVGDYVQHKKDRGYRGRIGRIEGDKAWFEGSLHFGWNYLLNLVPAPELDPNNAPKPAPALKVGDYAARKDGQAVLGKHCKVAKIIRMSPGGTQVWFNNHEGWHSYTSLVPAPKPAPEPKDAGTFIVALVEKYGDVENLVPAPRPKIHTYRDEAEKESERLSKVHLGKQFAVLKVVSISETPAPTTPETKTKRFD